MNHKEKLIELYQNSKYLHAHKIPDDMQKTIAVIANNCFQQKGVFTVVITLAVHKILYPSQDIRLHQSNMEKGFSGRSIDTKYITPTLKELGLPSMAESGWLTRSLEQPYPYDKKYIGKISNTEVRNAFLNIVDFIQHNSSELDEVVMLLLTIVSKKASENKVKIVPLNNPDKLNINDIIRLLESHFNYDYKTQGASKLPVLAFYAIFKSIIKEMARYNGCYLAKIGSHTASDLTSNSSGDIEIYDSANNLFESIEIKHNKSIDITTVRIAIEKIYKFNPKRYCIFSFVCIKEDDYTEIAKIINFVKLTHGCQIIVNGVTPTIKYYLRLISSLSEFIENYRDLVESDPELKQTHKEKLIDLFVEFNQHPCS
jgi:DNA (cytosine-5)-methyltransferase 1